MPKGEPSAQTVATQKYQDKVGMISKSYKLQKDLVERFREACAFAGISQAAQLTELMQGFIECMEEEMQRAGYEKKL